MERDVNLNLVYIILILLLALGATVIFYQMKYEKLKDDYESSVYSFNETMKNLSIKQKYMDNNLSEFNVSANRESVLVSRLEMKTKELESISMELSSVQKELFECQQTADLLNVNLTFSKEILDKHAASINAMQDKIDRLKIDVNSGVSKDVLLADIQQLQDELNRLKSN